MKLKLTMILLFFIISSSSTSGEELVYYTSYDNNNGKLCRGIHVGDQYYYEEYRGGQDLYENGTIYNVYSELQIFHIEVILIPDDVEGGIYFYNQTDPIYPNPSENSGWLASILGPFDSYPFIYLDWNAWKNMYNNITQKRIDQISILDDNTYEYYNPTQTQTTFTLTFLASGPRATINNQIFNIVYTSSSVYNKSDGTLISRFTSRVFTHINQELISSHQWIDRHLVSKEKVSEELVCLDPVITESINTKESPTLTFVYLALLVPITRMKNLGQK